MVCRPSVAAGLDETPSLAAAYSNWALNRAEAEVTSLLDTVRPSIPGMWTGPAYLGLPGGNVMLQIPLPLGGTLDPVPVFTYNSGAADSHGPFGCGFSDLFSPIVEAVDVDSATIVSGTGQSLAYTGKNAAGFYLAGGGAKFPETKRGSDVDRNAA